MVRIPVYKLIQAKIQTDRNGSTLEPWVEKILAAIDEEAIGFFDCVEVPPEAIKNP